MKISSENSIAMMPTKCPNWFLMGVATVKTLVWVVSLIRRDETKGALLRIAPRK